MNCQSKHRKENNGSDSDSAGDAHERGKRPRKSYDSGRKYLDSWEKEFPWLTSVVSANTRLPYCKLCRKTLKPHRGTLARHAEGAQHKDIVKSTSLSQVLNLAKKNRSVPDKLKRAELQLAVATCCHC